MSEKKEEEHSSSSSHEVEEDDSIRCRCDSKLDNKGLMLCCEQCEKWVHAACYRIRKNDVPEEFYCEVCRPPETELDFSNVEHAPLRAALEEDRDEYNYKPNMTRKRAKPSNEWQFRLEERLLLEKYWKLYVAADEDERSMVARQVGRLFSLTGDAVEQHFTLMAEDILDGKNAPLTTPLSGPGQALPKGGGKARQALTNSFSKAVQGTRTTRSGQAVAPQAEKQCRNGECALSDACHCRQNQQECCVDLNVGDCAQCGCGAHCSNAQLALNARGAPVAVVAVNGNQGWKVMAVDAVAPHAFVGEVVGKVNDSSAALKGYWTLPLKKECREIHVLSQNLVWDCERSSCDARFMRRSCRPSCVVRAVWVGTSLRLGVWASEQGLQPGQECTIPWDRPWDSLVCHVPCACDKSVPCPVQQWYAERETQALTLPIVRERIGTRRSEPPKPKDKISALLETTLNPFPDPPSNKMSREDRKLQQVLKAIEQMEKKEASKGSPSSAAPSSRSTRSPPARRSAPPPPPPPSAAAAAASELSPPKASAPPSSPPLFEADTATSPIMSPRKKLRRPDDTFSTASPVPPPVQPPVPQHQQLTPSLGKKAWMQKFASPPPPQNAQEPVPLPPPPTASPGVFGWKKRALMVEAHGGDTVAAPIKKSKPEIDDNK